MAQDKNGQEMLTRDPAALIRDRVLRTDELPALNPLSRAVPARVLVDLSHAADGYVGVAQDLRLIFSMLCELESVTPSGLLMPTGRHDLPHVRPGRHDEAAMVAAVLHWMERNWTRPERRMFPFSLIQRSQTLRQLVRNRHQLLPLANRGQMNALWRVLFAKTLPPSQRDTVLSQDFYATDLSVSFIIDRVVHPPFPMLKRLDARDFDAVLFCMPRPVRLPQGVRQIIRFHDAVPVTDTDTVVGWKMALAHSRLVRACEADAIFVCNSPQSRDTLLTLDPRREKHAVVIPCAIAPHMEFSGLDGRGIDLDAVINRHLTFRAMGPDIVSPPAGWRRPEAGMRYVLSVSTLEPRKNFPGLIRGWERASTTDPDLRLIIVGGSGWREETVLSQMRPGVESGRILHLQNLPPDELHTLMRGAACFAFPSFNEGFGFTPLEAMQAGAPCVVSDLPVFRWIFGDSAIYVDPYDADSIAAGIRRVTSPGASDYAREEADALAQTLRSRSAQILARFQPSSVGQAWESLLENVRRTR